ncbi:hypothetical protein, partial [Enterobacter hormaechei]
YAGFGRPLAGRGGARGVVGGCVSCLVVTLLLNLFLVLFRINYISAITLLIDYLIYQYINKNKKINNINISSCHTINPI